MHPIFHEKILNYMDLILCEPWKILKIWCVFVEKWPEMGTSFAEKSQNMGTISTYFWKNYP